MAIGKESTNIKTHKTERVVQVVINLTERYKEKTGEERQNATAVEANIVQFSCSMEEKMTKERKGLRRMEVELFAECLPKEYRVERKRMNNTDFRYTRTGPP